MGSELTEEQMQEFFSSFDQDGSGTIQVSELSNILKACGVDPTPLEVKMLVNNIGYITENGVINFPEFSAMWNMYKEWSLDDELKAIFRVVDTDESGYLSSDEVRQLLVGHGELISDGQLEEYMKVMDVNGDGRVNYDEFLKLMNLHRSYTT